VAKRSWSPTSVTPVTTAIVAKIVGAIQRGVTPAHLRHSLSVI
jgi:hypothetical protein